MNTLNISTGILNKGCRVYADGEQISLKRTQDGRFSGTLQTDKDEIEITVIKLSELYGRFWFLWAMLFFVISCFGIFNSHYDKRCVTVDYRVAVKLNGVSNLRLDANRFAEGAPAISLGSDSPFLEKVNVYGIDAKAKKRFKILTLVEVLLWLALLATCAAVFITRFI